MPIAFYIVIKNTYYHSSIYGFYIFKKRKTRKRTCNSRWKLPYMFCRILIIYYSLLSIILSTTSSSCFLSNVFAICGSYHIIIIRYQKVSPSPHISDSDMVKHLENFPVLNFHKPTHPLSTLLSTFCKCEQRTGTIFCWIRMREMRFTTSRRCKF